MSSSSVCQGLSSCLETTTGLVEPLVLRLKVAPLKPNSSRLPAPTQRPLLAHSPSSIRAGVPHDPSTVKTPTTGRSFFESDPPFVGVGGGGERAYVHPSLVKRSSSWLLNEKSLAMCTESLGSETGSDLSTIFSPGSSGEKTPSMPIVARKRLLSRSRSFPPPLTSITGSTGVEMRPHREGGRLVLEAVAVSSCRNSFQVERAEGCLRLRLWKDGGCEVVPPEEDDEAGEDAEVSGDIGSSEKTEGGGRRNRCKEGRGRPD